MMRTVTAYKNCLGWTGHYYINASRIFIVPNVGGMSHPVDKYLPDEDGFSYIYGRKLTIIPAAWGARTSEISMDIVPVISGRPISFDPLDNVGRSDSEPVKTEFVRHNAIHACNCDFYALLREGCKCGGV